MFGAMAFYLQYLNHRACYLAQCVHPLTVLPAADELAAAPARAVELGAGYQAVTRLHQLPAACLPSPPARSEARKVCAAQTCKHEPFAPTNFTKTTGGDR